MEEVVLSASSTEGAVHAWDLETGALVASFKGNACARGCLARLGRSHFLAAQSGSGALHAWAWGREQPALRCFPAEPLCALCASPDGSLVAGGGSSGALWLWQAASGKLLRTWAAHHKAAAALAFSADGSWLVSGGEDTAVTVWALAELAEGLLLGAQGCVSPPAPAHAWSAHTLPVTALATGCGCGSPLVASASLDRSCRVWTLAGGALLRTLLFPCALTCLALHPLDWALFCGGLDGRVFCAPLAGGQEEAAGFQLQAATRPLRALAASACGRRVVSAGDDGVLTVWCLDSRQALRSHTHARGAPVTALLTAPRAAVAGAGAAAAQARPTPLAQLAKFVTDALQAGAKPWEGPPVLLCARAPQPPQRQSQPLVAAAAASTEAAELRAGLEAARAEAARWKALHGELRALVADQL